MTRSNKGPSSNGADLSAIINSNETGKVIPVVVPDPPPAIPLIPENDPKLNAVSSDIDRQQFEKSLIAQMNLLTGTLNNMSAQFHTLQQEIVLMNGTLSEIKNQNFQQQILENKDEIDHITTRVSEVEASIQFNDSERAAIKDHKEAHRTGPKRRVGKGTTTQ